MAPQHKYYTLCNACDCVQINLRCINKYAVYVGCYESKYENEAVGNKAAGGAKREAARRFTCSKDACTIKGRIHGTRSFSWCLVEHL